MRAGKLHNEPVLPAPLSSRHAVDDTTPVSALSEIIKLDVLRVKKLLLQISGPPAAGQNRPKGHNCCFVDEMGQYEPEEQGTQEQMLDAPLIGLNVPAGHGWTDTLPFCGQYAPRVQGRHADSPD